MKGSENLVPIIRDVEKQWLNASRLYMEQHFADVFLPSHDVSHHLRTWKFSKLILGELSEINSTIDKHIVEAALLSAMFHDAGMLVTRKAEHGSESVKYYLDFIEKGEYTIPVLHEEILRAIELHDRKEDFIYQPFELNATPDLLTLTSISDDLDALGTIGIYRYIEIYLHRNTSMKSLGIKALQNVSLRFNHLVKASYALPVFINKMKQPYREIISFFDNYNQQILSETVIETTFSGHLGIANYLRQFCVEGKIRPEDFLDALNNFTVGNFVLNFFEELDKAINEKNS